MSHKRKSPEVDDDDLPAEVDFSKGVRGGYALKHRDRLKGILLDRKLVTAFDSIEEIEQALREHLERKAKRRKTA